MPAAAEESHGYWICSDWLNTFFFKYCFWEIGFEIMQNMTICTKNQIFELPSAARSFDFRDFLPVSWCLLSKLQVVAIRSKRCCCFYSNIYLYKWGGMWQIYIGVWFLDIHLIDKISSQFDVNFCLKMINFIK